MEIWFDGRDMLQGFSPKLDVAGQTFPISLILLPIGSSSVLILLHGDHFYSGIDIQDDGELSVGRG